jgi:enoyl-CoA hydratase/carnithine racemase
MSALQRKRIEPETVEILRLDRPAQRNALDSALLAELLDALDELSAQPDLRALVLSTTSERAFCAGADVSEQLDESGGVARMEAFARLYAALEAFPAPTICVCVGNCVGAGAELVAGCDLRVGGDNLKLSWPGARLGVPVGVARLAPLVGEARARELVFSGRTVGLEGAVALGLIARSATAEQAEQAAVELATELAAHPADGLRRLKALFRELSGSEHRVARENEILVEWQRHGAGLPYRPPSAAG